VFFHLPDRIETQIGSPAGHFFCELLIFGGGFQAVIRCRRRALLYIYSTPPRCFLSRLTEAVRHTGNPDSNCPPSPRRFFPPDGVLN